MDLKFDLTISYRHKTSLTGVYNWLFRCGLKEDNGGQCEDAIFLGHLLVVNLDKVDACLIRIVVDVLHFGKDTRTLLALVAVCQRYRKGIDIYLYSHWIYNSYLQNMTAT